MLALMKASQAADALSLGQRPVRQYMQILVARTAAIASKTTSCGKEMTESLKFCVRQGVDITLSTGCDQSDVHIRSLTPKLHHCDVYPNDRKDLGKLEQVPAKYQDGGKENEPCRKNGTVRI